MTDPKYMGRDCREYTQKSLITVGELCLSTAKEIGGNALPLEEVLSVLNDTSFILKNLEKILEFDQKEGGFSW